MDKLYRAKLANYSIDEKEEQQLVSTLTSNIEKGNYKFIYLLPSISTVSINDLGKLFILSFLSTGSLNSDFIVHRRSITCGEDEGKVALVLNPELKDTATGIFFVSFDNKAVRYESPIQFKPNYSPMINYSYDTPSYYFVGNPPVVEKNPWEKFIL